jgi:hypothetical protein
MLQERKRGGTKSAKAEGCGLTARISEPRLAAQNPHPFLPPNPRKIGASCGPRLRKGWATKGLPVRNLASCPQLRVPGLTGAQAG